MNEELREAIWRLLAPHTTHSSLADAVLALPEVAALLADAERVRNVRELHTRDATAPYACDYCGQAWPCDVIHALDTALDGDRP